MISWRFAGTGLFLLALALRAGWVLSQWTRHSGTAQFPDEVLHWQLATNLIEQGALVSDDGRYAARMPGYPAFLAIFAALGTIGPLLAKLAQALLGAVTAWAGYAWMRQCGGIRAGLVAGALIALDPYNVFFSNLLLTEVIFTLAAVGFAWSTWQLSERGNALPPGGCAVTCTPADAGAGSMSLWFAFLGVTLVFLRPSAAGWIALAWGMIACWGGSRRQRLNALGVAITTMVIAMTFWGMRNMNVLGAPTLLSANGGITLYDAQGPQADGSSNQEFMQALPELVDKSELERDRYLQQRALEEMKRDPLRVVQLAGVKFLRTWNPLPNYERYRGGAAAIVGAGYTVILLAGFLVALRKMREHPRLFVALLLPIAYFTFLHMIYIGSVRYRVPLMPLLALCFALNFMPRSLAQDRTAMNEHAGS
ncbi:MAG: glycosyltransferase family 39 protein [Phycisphaerae bacterium]